MSFLDFLHRRRHYRALRTLARWLPQPIGHFYSPLTDPDALQHDAARLWPALPTDPPFDFAIETQRALLREILPPLLAEFDYPMEAHADPRRFHRGNDQFAGPDALTLYALLRHWRPARMIEVGSGYSTLLAADVNRRFLGDGMRLTAIEPYPRDVLRALPRLAALREERVQDTPDHVFETLHEGDVLFIDSSHVLKTGSDLVHLLTRVLPRLRSGVRIHLHDVFLPDDYPPQWAIEENRGWNEQYAIAAMLANGTRYRVIFAVHFVLTRLADEARAAFGDYAGLAYQGGSFWIEVV
ncbi:MAG: class I SAM-dependent methyltransferase [Lysobacteraceae bacterium]|nr:MAG: class I SAM-dependent methyltransferase [Xanthomonadaceae bacterium]